MRRHIFHTFVLTILCYLTFSAASFSPAFGSGHELLQLGSDGPSVVLAQHFLYQLGLLRLPPDGMFGNATLEAVIQFQKERHLTSDGIVGGDTWQELNEAMLNQTARVHVVRPGETLWEIARRYGVSVTLLQKVNDIDRPRGLRPDQEVVVPSNGTLINATAPTADGAVPRADVELINWNEARTIYKNFKVAEVTDVWTGKRFHVRRFYGHLHADSEPVTQEDTETLRDIYGGWSWDRRPVILNVDGRRIAASMNGVPHGQGSIGNNGFPGHFCIHFLGSRIHRTGKIDIRHQTAVLEAAGYSVTDLWLAHK